MIYRFSTVLDCGFGLIHSLVNIRLLLKETKIALSSFHLTPPGTLRPGGISSKNHKMHFHASLMYYIRPIAQAIDRLHLSLLCYTASKTTKIKDLCLHAAQHVIVVS